MENRKDALDGSAQEISVNHENPISADPPRPTEGRKGAVTDSAPFEGIPISVCTLPADQSEPWEQVDEAETPFGKHGPERPRKAITAEAAVDKIVKLPLENLLVHPQNNLLFGPTSPDQVGKLAESIAETRQLSPLVVTAELGRIGCYVILSGHKRADALRSLNRTEADCQVVDVKEADERLLYLVEANRQQVPTTEQKIRIGEVHFGLETRKAKARQVAGAKAARKNGEVVEVFTQAPPPPAETGDEIAGKARDHAAAKIGMCGVSFDKGRKVLRALEKAEVEGKKASVTRLRELLNEKGVEPAYAHAKVLNLIETVSRQKRTGGKRAGTDVAAKGVDSNPVVAAVIPLKDSPSPASTIQIIDVRGTNAVTKSGENPPPVPAQVQEPATVADDEEQPLGVRAIAIGKKFVEALEPLEVTELTADLKGNLARTLDDVSNWQANHEQMLKLPGQL